MFLAFMAFVTLAMTGCSNDDNEVSNLNEKIVGAYNYNAVDMGLSVKWADANLGATSPEGYGDYYAWGETEINENYGWRTYKWCNGDYSKLTKYNNSISFGTVDDKTTLDADDDVAHVKLGGKWRMPTGSEVDELISTRNNANYRWEWKSINGHNGWLVTYLVNNNSIFLPAAGHREDTDLDNVGSCGYYWSSSLYRVYPYNAYYLYVDYFGVSKNYETRYIGRSVRPVSE